jgi:anti-sigma-K factor RskA
MNPNDHEHTESQLEAYALGALDLDERAQVEALLAASPEGQEELRLLREVTALLPYAAAPATPPDRVRQRLMARIASSARPAAVPFGDASGSSEADAQRLPVRPALGPAPRLRSRWFAPAVAVAATLMLALAGLTLALGSSVARLDATNRELVAALAGLQGSLADTQARQDELAGQVAEGQRQIEQLGAELAAGEERLAQLRAELAQDEYVISFVSAPGVATRQLTAAQTGLSAQGEMYMYPGNASAVVLFSGLPALAPGEVYQFWLADGQGQVGAATFIVDGSGIGHIVVVAPREVNAFSQVMVTVEPEGGSSTPSDEVVLEGSL